jgi:mRNA interferase HigB
MVVVSRSILRDFIDRFPLGAKALNKWYENAIESDWNNFDNIKETWGACSFLGSHRYVFDISENRYRLVAMINFSTQILYIRRILTNEEYSQLSDKELLDAL